MPTILMGQQWHCVFESDAEQRSNRKLCEHVREKPSLKTRRVIPPSIYFLFITLCHKENVQGQ